MNRKVEIDSLSREEWIRSAKGFSDHNFCQCWDYGVLRAEDTGSVSSHAIVRDDSQLVAMAECRVKKVPLLGVGIAYASGGPLLHLSDRDPSNALKIALDSLTDAYVRQRGLVLRLSPRILRGLIAETTEVFRECGFAQSPMATPTELSSLTCRLS